MKMILRITIFPLALVVGVASTMIAMERGVDPVAAMFGVYVAGMFVVTALERLLPFDREWNHSYGDLGADALYLPTTWIVGGLLQPASAALALVLASWLSSTIGIGLWPTDWPLLAQVALSSDQPEDFESREHRAMHESRTLRRLHASLGSARRR